MMTTVGWVRNAARRRDAPTTTSAWTRPRSRPSQRTSIDTQSTALQETTTTTNTMAKFNTNTNQTNTGACKSNTKRD